MNDEKILVILAMEGGVLQAARSDNPNVVLEVLDYDDMEETEQAEEMKAREAEYERLPHAIY